MHNFTFYVFYVGYNDSDEPKRLNISQAKNIWKSQE